VCVHVSVPKIGSDSGTITMLGLRRFKAVYDVTLCDGHRKKHFSHLHGEYIGDFRGSGKNPLASQRGALLQESPQRHFSLLGDPIAQRT